MASHGALQLKVLVPRRSSLKSLSIFGSRRQRTVASASSIISRTTTISRRYMSSRAASRKS